MKNISFLCFFVLVSCLLGCDNTVQQKGLEYVPFSENPVTITWKGETAKVESYQANVHVFTMNNRTDTHATLSQSYRLAISTIRDRVHTRIDFEQDADIPFRSVISDGDETIIFDPSTEEIAYRVQSEDSQSPLYRVFSQQTSMSRVNLSLIRNEAMRLSIRMREENDGDNKTLLLELPPDLLPKYGNDTIISSRVSFDVTTETLLESEVVMKLEDDTIVTTTVTPVYEESNGVPVKIGQVTVIDSKAPGLIEGVDPDIPIYNSLDDLPLVSEAELENNGNAGDVVSIIFGNPADLSYVETIYEVYQEIEINSAPDQLFRLIQK